MAIYKGSLYLSWWFQRVSVHKHGSRWQTQSWNRELTSQTTERATGNEWHMSFETSKLVPGTYFYHQAIPPKLTQIVPPTGTKGPKDSNAEAVEDISSNPSSYKFLWPRCLIITITWVPFIHSLRFHFHTPQCVTLIIRKRVIVESWWSSCSPGSEMENKIVSVNIEETLEN